MRWLDPIWWRGTATLSVAGIPPEGGMDWLLLVLRRNGEAVEVREQTRFNDAGQLTAALLEKGHPVVAWLGGSFALEGYVTEAQAADPVSAVLSVGVESDDEFAMMRLPAAEGGQFISMMRADRLEAALSPLGDAAGKVIEAVFSPAALALLAGAPEGPSRLAWGERVYVLQDGLFTPGSEGGPLIENESLAREFGLEIQFLPMLAAAVYAWSRGAETGVSDAVHGRFAEYSEVEKLKRAAFFATGTLAILALWLLWFRISNMNEKQRLETEFAENLPMMDAVAEKRAEVQARLDLKGRLQEQTLRQSRSSWYLDQIGRITPENLRISRLVIGAEGDDYKKVQVREPLDFEIILSGESPGSQAVAEFSSRLQNESWIDHLKVQRSEMNLRTGLYDFVFFLKLKHV